MKFWLICQKKFDTYVGREWFEQIIKCAELRTRFWERTPIEKLVSNPAFVAVRKVFSVRSGQVICTVIRLRSVLERGKNILAGHLMGNIVWCAAESYVPTPCTMANHEWLSCRPRVYRRYIAWRNFRSRAHKLSTWMKTFVVTWVVQDYRFRII